MIDNYPLSVDRSGRLNNGDRRWALKIGSVELVSIIAPADYDEQKVVRQLFTILARTEKA